MSTKTFCPYFNDDKCGSCTLIELPYEEQIKRKENVLLHSLRDHKFTLLRTVTSPEKGFRNKAKLSVTGTIDRPVIGLLGEEDLDQGREILHCPVHIGPINRLLEDLPSFITVSRLAPYEVKTKKGELKGLILFYSETSREMFLRFVLRSKESIDRIKKNLPELQKKWPELTCISANIQPVPHAILEGEEEVVLMGNDIENKLGDFPLRVSPRAFLQTNQKVAHELYSTAALWVQELKTRKMAELFCGQGAFSFYCSPHVEEGLGIEINVQAIETAKSMAEKLKLSHLKFLCSSAEKVQAEIHRFAPDLILVNPPRRGLAQSLDVIKDSNADDLIYSSCSLESLKKDLDSLKDVYQLQRAQIFDMFPHTDHFEILTLLKRLP